MVGWRKGEVQGCRDLDEGVNWGEFLRKFLEVVTFLDK